MKEILFECNPQLNRECTKSGCYIHGGPCYLTTRRDFAVDKDGGRPARDWPDRTSKSIGVGKA